MAMTGAERQARYMERLLGDVGKIHRERVELKKRLAVAEDARRDNAELRKRLASKESFCEALKHSYKDAKELLAERDAQIAALTAKRPKRRHPDLKAKHLDLLDQWCANSGRPVPVDTEGRINNLIACAVEALEDFSKEPEAVSINSENPK